MANGSAAEALAAEEPERRGFFRDFCQTTSLHGWRFLASPSGESYGKRALLAGWALVVLASIGVAAFFLSNSVIDFLSSAVQTTQDTSR